MCLTVCPLNPQALTQNQLLLHPLNLRVSGLDVIISPHFAGKHLDASPLCTCTGEGPSRGLASQRRLRPKRKRGAAAKKQADTRASKGWKKDGWSPRPFPFTGTQGPRGAAADIDSEAPVDFLELFLTDEIMEHIVDQTNLYARRDGAPARTWSPLTVQELKRCLGLSFVTGYLKKPTLQMYWALDCVEATPYFNHTMARNRFQSIYSNLHFNDNSLDDKTDRLYKVRPVLDYLVGKFKELYQPGENICVDEAMIPWRGRLSFKVYSPLKPSKYGMRLYVLSDSSNGYCFKVRPYYGETMPLGETVFWLLDRLTGLGHTLYMDNYYNSVALCEQLISAGTNVCGTLRRNRGEPPLIKSLTKKDLETGDKVSVNNGRILIIAWFDKRLVKMITTCHEDTMVGRPIRVKGRPDKVTKFKPATVLAYNDGMHAVDRLDQNIAYYPFIRKTIKWPKKFVFFLFQLAIFNSYLLFKSKHPTKCPNHLTFIRMVAKSWTCPEEQPDEESDADAEDAEDAEDGDAATRHGPRAAAGSRRAPRLRDPERRLDGKLKAHVMVHLPRTRLRRRPRRKCRVCWRKGRRRETMFWCDCCRIPLCVGDCFRTYHTAVQYY